MRHERPAVQFLEPMTAADHPDLRASDREREHTIDVLRDAAGEGRLTFEELADRIDVAAGARTRGELAQVTRDLPAAAATAAAVATAASGAVDMPVERSSVFGEVRRSGAWVVPVQSRWRTYFGEIVLDLREARVSAPEVTIQADSVFGSIRLVVPEGVIVEVRSRTIFGSVRQQSGDAASPGAPRVILVGGTTFGEVHVHAERLRERIADRLLGRGGRG
jgi:hypothetical protein